MTNQERVEASTSRLLDAAIQLFAEKGYERTTAAEIGTRAGFSRNMVRDRYGSKEALLESLFEHEFGQRLLPTIRTERSGSGLELVLGQLDDLLTAVEQDPSIMRAMIRLSFEAPGALESIRPWYENLLATYQTEMVEHLAAGQSDGSVRDGLDLEREAEIFVSYGIGLCFRWVLQPDDYDFPREIKAWRKRLEASYSPQP